MNSHIFIERARTVVKHFPGITINPKSIVIGTVYRRTTHIKNENQAFFYGYSTWRNPTVKKRSINGVLVHFFRLSVHEVLSLSLPFSHLNRPCVSGVRWFFLFLLYSKRLCLSPHSLNDCFVCYPVSSGNL